MRIDGKYEVPTHEIIGTIQYFNYDKELFLVYEDNDKTKWCYINPFEHDLMYIEDVEQYVKKTFVFRNCTNFETMVYSPQQIEEIKEG